MKKSFILTIFLVLLTLPLASCGDVANFEARQESLEAVARDIENYLVGYNEINDCTVKIDGKTAVISLDLTRDLDSRELIALKRRVVADTRWQSSGIRRVAVNTAPDMLEKIQGGGDDAPEIERALERNRDEEIFDNIAPTF